MSEFFLCEIENIEKSGVEIKVTGTRFKKDDDDCIRTVRTVCFDFSEHDKVFEDKYKVLKEEYDKKCKDYKSVSGLLSTYQQENEALKKRIIELENFSCQAEQETESLVEKLKQRIAELESKNNQLTESILRKETKIHELESKKRKRPCFVSYVGVEEINGKEYVSMEKFATAMEELNAFFDKFFDS
jgi:DNA repair exonuclease SbcCD ATPase subunit